MQIQIGVQPRQNAAKKVGLDSIGDKRWCVLQYSRTKGKMESKFSEQRNRLLCIHTILVDIFYFERKMSSTLVDLNT